MDDCRPPHHKRKEAKKKSRSLPPNNRHAGISVDHKAIFAAYEKEEQRNKERREYSSSISSDTSCSSLEFLKPGEILDAKMAANDSSSSVEKRNHSSDSLSRKEKMEALKARVEAERQKYCESSSEEDVEHIKRLSRYHSDEAIHHTSRDHNRSRSARTERYLKRRSQDETSLKNFRSRKPPVGRAGKSWQEVPANSPIPTAKEKPVSQNESLIIKPPQNNHVLTPLNVVTAPIRVDQNLCQPSPNDSGVSTQSVASSPSIGRAPSPPKRIQEMRLLTRNELCSKSRIHNFSPSDRSRSSSDVRSDKNIPSPVPTSPVPRSHTEMSHRCRRMSTGDAENCSKSPSIPVYKPQCCCCHTNRMCCALPFRLIPACSSHTDCNKKPIIYSYTDQAPRYIPNSQNHVKRMISRIQNNGENKLKSYPSPQTLIAKSCPAKPIEMNHSSEISVPSCPVHLIKPGLSRMPSILPNKTEFNSSIPRLCSIQKTPPSPNCRPLSMVMDTLDYLTNPKNYTNIPITPPKTISKPIPPVPPVRKYHWTSTLNLNTPNKLKIDDVKKTRNSLTSPECEYRVSDSDEKQFNRSTKLPDSSKSNNIKSLENLDEALRELEEIYQSLKLNDEDLVDRAERRDLPTRCQQYSFTRHSPTLQKKEENLQKRPISGSYDCLLVCNRPVQVRAPPLRRSGITDKVTDDLAYRRFQRAVAQIKQPKPEMSQSYLLCSSVFTPSIEVEEYFKDLTTKSQPDIDKDDLSYRNYTQSNGARVPPVHPPFGIPLGPVVKSSSNSYLQALPSKQDTRPIYRHQETPDVVRDDMAYRKLRKDPANVTDRQNKKYRAVRSLSANIAQLIKQHKEEETSKNIVKTQSMTDIIAALEEQSSEWNNLSKLASTEHIKSPESSSTDDTTPRCTINNIGSGTSDGLTLSESSSECKSPKKEIHEKRLQPEGSESIVNMADTDPVNKRGSMLADCCRLMSVTRDSRKQKSLSVYQPSVSSPPLKYHDVWSDTDIKMKRRTIALDENQLEALLTSLSSDTKQSMKGEERPLENTSNYISNLRVTA